MVAHRHPRLCESFLPAPTSVQDTEVAAVLIGSVGVVGSVLADIDMDPADMAPLTQALQVSIHGFVHLEVRGGPGPPDGINPFTTTIDLVMEAMAGHATT